MQCFKFQEVISHNNISMTFQSHASKGTEWNFGYGKIMLHQFYKMKI